MIRILMAPLVTIYMAEPNKGRITIPDVGLSRVMCVVWVQEGNVYLTIKSQIKPVYNSYCLHTGMIGFIYYYRPGLIWKLISQAPVLLGIIEETIQFRLLC